MKKPYASIFALLLLASPGGWASVLDVSGIVCSEGGLTVATGAAFSVWCPGDLRIEASGVIEAGESIRLVAAGALWMGGTLIAPRIELMAHRGAHLAGGLFSGSPEYFPEVNAVTYAGSPSATLSTFNDIVAHPFIHPVHGAATIRRHHGPLVQFAPVEVHEFVPIPEGTPNPVPEPAMPLLFALGASFIIWKRRHAKAECRQCVADLRRTPATPP